MGLLQNDSENGKLRSQVNDLQNPKQKSQISIDF